MSRSGFVLLSMMISAVLMGGCFKTATETEQDDLCGPSKAVKSHDTLNADPNDVFYLETPAARNDCEATFNFFFRWADPLRRAAEETGHEEMPPIEDISRIFVPSGEFSYFPHPAAVYSAEAEISMNGTPLGRGWWYISFKIGHKNSSYPNTNYAISCRLDPAKATSDYDKTEISANITYYDKPISNGH